MRKQSAFTLIELLIVVAIIAVLAAIAVPNFLEAQTRSKVSRVKADMRSLVTAIESYRVDNSSYIPGWQAFNPARGPDVVPGTLPGNFNIMIDKFVRWRLTGLTTPLAYMTALPETPFLPLEYWHSGGSIKLTANVGAEYDTELPGFYNNTNAMVAGAMPSITKYHLRDAGPDYVFTNRDANFLTNLTAYDPTNGTVSVGDIWRFGP